MGVFIRKERLTVNKFNDFFKNKFSVSPISDRALRNLQLKVHGFSNLPKREFCSSDSTKYNKLVEHYSAISHDFKSLDLDKLLKLIQNIKDLNSHYIHDFENIAINDSDSLFIFLKDSFELASLTVSGILGEVNQDKKITKFLYEIFNLTIHPNSNKDKCIQEILFINNTKEDKTTEWFLKNGKKAFNIREGKYLSFYGSLFLLSMFLYQDEAELLIPRIQYLKRNLTNEEQYRRKIFSFYSRRLRRREIASEDSHLIKFRDIVQYLNKYPYEWYSAYNYSEIPKEIREKFIKDILRTETDRALLNRAKNRVYYIKEEDREDFYRYARYQVWGLDKKKFIKMSFKRSQIDDFNNVLATSLEIQGIIKCKEDLIKYYGESDKRVVELQDIIKTRTQTDRKSSEDEIRLRAKNIGMTSSFELEKIKSRFYNGDLVRSYCRNTDSFMQYTTRFLAESNFFGKNAKFKCYKWFTSEEQDADIVELKESLTKKGFDSLKYHQGRLVEYIKYSDFLKKKEYHSLPFVIQNNAVQVKIKIGGSERILSIQRKLMVNLLHYALYDNLSQKKTSDLLSLKSLNNRGLKLFNSYFKEYKNDFSDGLEYLKQVKEIDSNKPSSLVKLFPKRLLHNYSSASECEFSETNVNMQLLVHTKKQNWKYKDLYKDAQKKNVLTEFLQKNKWKRYKLAFIKKAWNLMYFKEIYLEQRALATSHHKGFNITKEEYNDFCNAMFSFNSNDDAYKIFLRDLFKSKKFFNNKEFKSLFDDSSCLDDLYIKTLKAYEFWISSSFGSSDVKKKFELVNYKFINEAKKHIVYINLSHFLGFLKKYTENFVEDGKLQYGLLDENKDVLIKDYYLDYESINKNDKIGLKFFNRLNSIRFEDVLLYEIALCYFKLDSHSVEDISNTSVLSIYNSDISYRFKDISLVVPFKKLLDFELCLNKGVNKVSENYLKEVSNYLSLLCSESDKPSKDYFSSERIDLVDLYYVIKVFSRNKTLSLNSFCKFNSHLVNSAIKFSKIWLVLEEYYIKKYDKEIASIIKDHRVDYEKLEVLSSYKPKSAMISMRDAAFQVGIPLKYSFYSGMKILEKNFILQEIKDMPLSYSVLSKDVCKVCNEFINILYDTKCPLRDSNGRWNFYSKVIEYYLKGT